MTVANSTSIESQSMIDVEKIEQPGHHAQDQTSANGEGTTMLRMIDVTAKVLFLLSAFSLLTALVVIETSIADGHPDAAYPTSNMLALGGIGIALMAIGISTCGRSRLVHAGRDD